MKNEEDLFSLVERGGGDDRAGVTLVSHYDCSCASGSAQCRAPLSSHVLPRHGNNRKR